jgi:hypothetical protein
VALADLFLASGSSPWITDVTLDVAGGYGDGLKGATKETERSANNQEVVD